MEYGVIVGEEKRDNTASLSFPVRRRRHRQVGLSASHIREGPALVLDKLDPTLSGVYC